MTFAKDDRILHTSPDGVAEYGTVFSMTNPAMPHLTLLVKFDDGTFCNVPADRCVAVDLGREHTAHIKDAPRCEP